MVSSLSTSYSMVQIQASFSDKTFKDAIKSYNPTHCCSHIEMLHLVSGGLIL